MKSCSVAVWPILSAAAVDDVVGYSCCKSTVQSSRVESTNKVVESQYTLMLCDSEAVLIAEPDI
jgi:hypothetical protein